MALTTQRIEALEDTLSAERLNRWQRLAEHQNLAAWRARAGIRLPANRAAAIRLHQWNAALSMAFMASIQVFELALRNKLNAALQARAQAQAEADARAKGTAVPGPVPAWWLPLETKLQLEQQEKVREAEAKVRKTNRQVTQGRVVAELTLGFWVALTGPGYDNPRVPEQNLWRTCLAEVFRPLGGTSPKRAELNENLNKIRLLRNNVAHHEPIIDKNLSAEYSLLLAETRRLCPETGDWLAETSLVPGLLGADWLKALAAAGRLVGSH